MNDNIHWTVYLSLILIIPAVLIFIIVTSFCALFCKDKTFRSEVIVPLQNAMYFIRYRHKRYDK